jgi:toxin FitB
VAQFLLDTNIISEFARPLPAATVVAFLEDQKLQNLFIADVVLAEVRFGISLLADDARRAHYETVLNQAIRPMFENRVLSTGEETWLIWKSIEYSGR